MVAQRELRAQRFVLGAQGNLARLRFRGPPRLPLARHRIDSLLDSLPVCSLARAHRCVPAMLRRRPPAARPCRLSNRVRACGSLSAVIDPNVENLSSIANFTVGDLRTVKRVAMRGKNYKNLANIADKNNLRTYSQV